MDKVIKEGTLRVLISESICDVVLSCKDHRLMAHKLILSIASPVFRELLQKNSTDATTVIILPDINASTMSTVLDYIYTGTAVVYSNSLQEFLSVAHFLQIAVDPRSIESVLESLQKVEDVKKLEIECSEKRYAEALTHRMSVEKIEYSKMDIKKQDVEGTKERLEGHSVDPKLNLLNVLTSDSKLFQTKAQKRLPDLLPIRDGTFRKNTHRKMCNMVVPSPWSQRNERSFLGDPRAETLKSSESRIQKLPIEDTNNNFQFTQNSESPKCSPKSLDSIIRHLYLSNLESDKKRTNKITKNSTILGKDYSRRRDFITDCSESYQKDVTKTPEVPDISNFSFSRCLTDLKRLKSKRQPESIDLKLSVSNKSDFSSLKSSDNQNPRTFPSDYNLEPIIRNTSPLDLVQNLSLSRNDISLPLTSPTHLPPSNIVTQDSPTLSNIPLSSSKNTQESNKPDFKKLTKSVDIEPSSNSNDNSYFNDVSNDNSLSNESSSDEKKEDDANVKKKSYKCGDCGKCFSQLRNYKYHRSVHEGTKEFSAKCPECGKIFNDRGYLSSHMKIHRDRKEYACPNCPKRFNQRVAYNMHLRIHTGVKPHECPTCGKSFSRKMLLKQHQRVHTGERPYTCPECGKTFADRSNMSLHARLHTGVKPYACTLCPKSFTKKHHLKTHMNFHTGLKPYTCEKCGLAFSQSSNMRTHYKKCILKDGIGKSTISESVSSAENNSS